MRRLIMPCREISVLGLAMLALFNVSSGPVLLRVVPYRLHSPPVRRTVRPYDVRVRVRVRCRFVTTAIDVRMLARTAKVARVRTCVYGMC